MESQRRDTLTSRSCDIPPRIRAVPLPRTRAAPFRPRTAGLAHIRAGPRPPPAPHLHLERTMKPSFLPAATALAACLLAAGAGANTNNNEPGSLLVFPLFDNTGGATIISVVNTNSDFTPGPGFGQFAGSVRVEFVYINSVNCFEFNRTRTLTPNDEITVLTAFDNPGMEQGYLYVFAKHLATGQAIKFDWLIGTAWQLDAVSLSSFEFGPYVYKAVNRLAQGANTDTDGDGVRDLNGLEYEQSPDHLLVPRFFGQVPGPVQLNSELVLLNLTGGGQFFATVNFLVYNDNEEVFSRNMAFRCWTKLPLATISGSFSQAFLSTGTTHDPAELIGVPQIETGWFEIDGNIAASTNTAILDPAFLAFLIERTGSLAGAELAFEMGKQANGDLLPIALGGDLQ